MGSDKDTALIEEIKKSVFPDADNISRIGSAHRPNSDTFKISQIGSPPLIIKLLKVTKRIQPEELENEQSVHQRIKDSGLTLAISELLQYGSLKYKSMKIPYLVFPFIEGGDLASHLGKAGVFSEADVEEVMKFGVKAIHDLQTLNIEHQDIKPGNIIKGKQGYVLIDLGIAKFIDIARPELSKPQGPARYLSPEKISLGLKKCPENRRKLSYVSDLYSLGVVCFELLAGKDFNKLWDIGMRHEASEKIRSGELLDIESPLLKERLASLLEFNVADRLKACNEVFDLEVSGRGFKVDHWLHNPSKEPVKAVLRELPEAQFGVVLSAHKCNDSTGKLIETLREAGKSVIIDPITYRMQFNSANHKDTLIRLPYYREKIDEYFPSDPEDVKVFTEEVISYQKEFNPSFYIAPYFFVESPSDTLLTLSFSTYKIAKRFMERSGVDKQLAFGIVLSREVLKNEQFLSDIADQIVLNADFKAVYLQIEMPKSNHLPLADRRILKALDKFLDKITLTKAVLVCNIDQSILAPFAKHKFAVGINPKDPRKHDIDAYKKVWRGQIHRKGEDYRYRVYIPELFSDLDIDRDLSKPEFAAISDQLTETNKSYVVKKIGGLGNFKSGAGTADLRAQHFIDRFGKQLQIISAYPPGSEERKRSLTDMLDVAETYFSKFNNTGLALDAQNTGEFIESWREVLQ